MSLFKLIREKEGSIYKYAKRISQETGRDAMTIRNGIYNLKYIDKPRTETVKFHSKMLGVPSEVIKNGFKIENARKILKEANAFITQDGEILYGKTYTD